MNDKRQHRCCFTGHRPNKLDYSEGEIKPLLETAVDNAISDGYVTFITGMAEGVDIWAAEIVLEKKKDNKDLHLICAVPHPGFEKRRSQYETERYKNIIKNADYVTTISDNYYRACYQKRNIWMVDRSSRVISVYNGKSGGTQNTINYAIKRGIEIIKLIVK